MSGPTAANPTPVRRVWPVPIGDDAGSTTVEQACQHPRPAPAGRPWVTLCMITSLDGAIAVEGGSGRLGNRTDLAVLVTLRRLADVIIVGHATAVGEGYGPPSTPGTRIGVVSRSAAVDVTTALFRSGAGFVICPQDAHLDAAVDALEVDVVRAGHGSVDLAAAIAALHTVVPGVRHVQAEGGPRLNAALLEADLIDELALTLSPMMVGNPSTRLVHGSTGVDHRFSLDQLLVDTDGFVLGRWLRTR